MSERERASKLLSQLGMPERRQLAFREGIDRATDEDLATASSGLEAAVGNIDAALDSADQILARRRASTSMARPHRCTAIFVYQPTTLTIESDEDDLALVGFRGSVWKFSRSTKLDVAVGIYKIESSKRVTVSASTQIDVQASSHKDDRLPEPPPRARALMEDAFRAFLQPG